MSHPHSIEERMALDGFDTEFFEPVLFYGQRNENGQYSNFSAHEITLPHPWTGEPYEYPTGEYRYQAMKGKDQKAHDYVCQAASSSKAKDRGRAVDLRAGWGNDYGDLCWYVMMEITNQKAFEHFEIAKALYRTEENPIYEDSPTDDIWGVRYHQSYTGKNLLGRCWMETRRILFEHSWLIDGGPR